MQALGGVACRNSSILHEEGHLFAVNFSHADGVRRCFTLPARMCFSAAPALARLLPRPLVVRRRRVVLGGPADFALALRELAPAAGEQVEALAEDRER